jgi:5-methylcytosine-specific restriction endonuclease McrA
MGYTPQEKRAYHKRVREAAAAAKVAAGCAACGYNAHADALEFDHILPVGKGRVQVSSPSNLDKILNDPNVQVLCANCHAIKSQAERRVWNAIDPS